VKKEKVQMVTSYRIMSTDGCSIQWVKPTASSENRMELCKADAEKKRDRWIDNYFRDRGETTLLVVPCTGLKGEPLK
jgi:hypothetical protein